MNMQNIFVHRDQPIVWEHNSYAYAYILNKYRFTIRQNIFKTQQILLCARSFMRGKKNNKNTRIISDTTKHQSI